MAKYASGKYALGECDRCGLTHSLNDLRYEYEDRRRTGFRVCSDCWSPDHPQLQFGKQPVVDAEALRDPRPGRRSADLNNIRWGWNPVYAIEVRGIVGEVSVSIETAPAPVVMQAIFIPSAPSPSPTPLPDAEEDEILGSTIDALHSLIGTMTDPSYW